MAHRPYKIIVHDVIDLKARIIGPGHQSGSSGTEENARKALSRHLRGGLTRSDNVAHIVNEDTGEDCGWWYMGTRTSTHGNSISMQAVPARYVGPAFTITEP